MNAFVNSKQSRFFLNFYHWSTLYVFSTYEKLKLQAYSFLGAENGIFVFWLREKLKLERAKDDKKKKRI